VIALVHRSLGRAAAPLVAVASLLAGFQTVLVAAAGVITSGAGVAGLVHMVPNFLQQSIGVAILSFAGLTTIGFYHALIVTIVVQFAIYLASEPAGDVESGVVDLMLARPLPRHMLVTRSLIVMTASTAALTTLMSLALWTGLWLLASNRDWPATRVVVTMAVHLTIVAWCFGSASLAASGWARRRGSAVTVVGVAAMALYLLDVLAGMWTALAGVARVSPFHYFHGGEILAGTANTAIDLTVLGGIAIAAIALAYWQFNRRDL
jgi:beta-exotoxin I transport system permease protein